MYISYIETEMCMLYLYTLTWFKKKGDISRKEGGNLQTMYIHVGCVPGP